MSINSLSNKNAPNVVASASLQSNGAIEVRKRKKWTMEMNIFIIREYFRITKLQDVVSTYRLDLFKAFESKYPKFPVTIQNLADQRRAIMKKNYILSAILEKIKNDVKLELSINYFDNNEHIISSCTVLAQSEYKKRHDIFAKIIHMNLAVKFNLLKNTQPHYSYTPESCLENDSYKLYFDRTILTDIHIKHNRPDIIILNKQQKQAYLLDIAVPNSHNITQTYNTKINKYLELSVAMRNLWCLEKISILPLVISATGIVPQSLFKNLKILDLDNTLVVEIQKDILLYSCHIVRKFLNIDTEHNTQQSQNAEARRR
jgi:signal recognition particle subunit SEC65